MTRTHRTLAALAALVLATSARADAGPDRMPANREKIAAALVERGQVPRDATPEQLDAAVDAYLQRVQGERPGSRRAREAVQQSELSRATGLGASAIRGRKLGQSTYVAASTPAFKPLAKEGKLLLLLVDFSDAPFTWGLTDARGNPVLDGSGAQVTRTEAGPLHNRIPQPGHDYDLWLPDFSADHYERMLFSDGGWTIPYGPYAGERRISMRDYYLAQSYGKYTISGDAYGWFTVDKPEAYYGDNDPVTGGDQLPGRTWDLIRDAVQVANAQGGIPWADYDTDGDCVLDHVLVIHAGVDESAGGGEQGEDAIWAHSWDVLQDPPVVATSAACPAGLRIVNYTIMPEDGSVGVFAHEFGHDLGLPDEYDTQYTGRGESVANWSLMSQGSWTGIPAQTEPTNMSVWARWALGWLVAGDNLGVVGLGGLSSEPQVFRLEQASFWGGARTLNGMAVVLPDTVVLAGAHAGTYAWFGGAANAADARLTRNVDLRGKASASLSFWTWYDIEPYWDYAFVQLSSDGGATWTSLPVPGATTAHDPDAEPFIVANLPGLTGKSGGWVQKAVDLSAWAGQQIQLRFRYMTDFYVVHQGFYVDDVTVLADGAAIVQDGAETADPAWTLEGGFVRKNPRIAYPRFYMAEWRNPAAFSASRGGVPILNPDAGLQRATQYDPLGSTGDPLRPWLYPYNPGLLVWLRDYAYTDNWTRAHLGHGFLLVVDAHDAAIFRPSAGNAAPGVGAYPFNTHVQISDATFSLDRAVDFRLGYWGSWRDYTGQNAQPIFEDKKVYRNQLTPDASTLVPTFGLTLRVLGEAGDDSAALVGIGRN